MQITLTVDSFDELFHAALQILNIKGPIDEVLPASEKPKKAAAPKKVKKEEPAEWEDPDPNDPVPFETKEAEVDETAVKVLLAEKLKAGKKADVKALFAEYGVDKLSELIEQHPDKLDEFYAKAGVL